MSQSPPGADTLTAATDMDHRRRLDAREPAALAEIYDRHAGKVYSLALRMLRAPAEAEDLTQLVFTTLWRRPAAYDPARGPLGAWLLLLTRSRAVDQLRSLKARRDRGLVAGVEETLPDAIDPSPRPDEALQASQDGSLVRAALASLPAPQREAIEVAFFEGLSQSEVAEKLGVPLGTIKTRIRDGMRKMKAALEAAGGAGDGPLTSLRPEP